MKCERCQVETVGHELHDYCANCGRNLCEACLRDGHCSESAIRRHRPAYHGGEHQPAQVADTCTTCLRQKATANDLARWRREFPEPNTATKDPPWAAALCWTKAGVRCHCKPKSAPTTNTPNE